MHIPVVRIAKVATMTVKMVVITATSLQQKSGLASFLAGFFIALKICRGISIIVTMGTQQPPRIKTRCVQGLLKSWA